MQLSHRGKEDVVIKNITNKLLKQIRRNSLFNREPQNSNVTENIRSLLIAIKVLLTRQSSQLRLEPITDQNKWRPNGGMIPLFD